MITWILAALILGAAGYIIFKKAKKMKAGDFSCEGCAVAPAVPAAILKLSRLKKIKINNWSVR